LLTIVSKVFNSLFEVSTLKYLLVGFLTVAIDYSVIYLFYSILNLYYVFAIVLGFFVSNVFQFLSNFFFTFQLKKDAQMKRRAIAYVISSTFGMILGTLVIIGLESFIQSLYISKAISLIVSFAYGFFASKYIVYNFNFRF